MESIPGWAKIVGLVVVIVLVFGGCGVIKANGVINERNKLENSLSVKYSDTQNSLSRCVQVVKNSGGTTLAAIKNADELLTNVISARDTDPNQPESTQIAFRQALQEAYPDTSQFTVLYTKAMNAANGCIDDFTGEQAALGDELRIYSDYLNGSGLFTKMITGQKPSDNLEAQRGEDVKTGEEAYRLMRRLVLSREATDSFDSGDLELPSLAPAVSIER